MHISERPSQRWRTQRRSGSTPPLRFGIRTCSRNEIHRSRTTSKTSALGPCESHTDLSSALVERFFSAALAYGLAERESVSRDKPARSSDGVEFPSSRGARVLPMERSAHLSNGRRPCSPSRAQAQ